MNKLQVHSFYSVLFHFKMRQSESLQWMSHSSDSLLLNCGLTCLSRVWRDQGWSYERSTLLLAAYCWSFGWGCHHSTPPSTEAPLGLASSCQCTWARSEWMSVHLRRTNQSRGSQRYCNWLDKCSVNLDKCQTYSLTFRTQLGMMCVLGVRWCRLRTTTLRMTENVTRIMVNMT